MKAINVPWILPKMDISQVLVTDLLDPLSQYTRRWSRN
jgi:hypothetical protein